MDDKIQKLIETLVKGTRSGVIKWEQGYRNSEFLTNLRHASVMVDKWVAVHDGTQTEATHVDLRVNSSTGEMLEHIVYNDIDDSLQCSVLIQLHDLARRAALNVDKVLESILDEISELITASNKS